MLQPERRRSESRYTLYEAFGGIRVEFNVLISFQAAPRTICVDINLEPARLPLISFLPSPQTNDWKICVGNKKSPYRNLILGKVKPHSIAMSKVHTHLRRY